ncbi:MAG: hypothetical protein ACI8ZH_001222 [Flavobacteriales bacterium]|jgi:hypothetical protein
MNNKKKTSLASSRTNALSFTEIFFIIYTLVFSIIGFVLLFFTDKISLLTLVGEQTKLTILVEQFLGSFMILLSFLLFSVRKLKGQVILNSIKGLILVGFINLYLLFSLSENIILPTVYFIFQLILMLSFFVALFEQLKRK